MSNDLKIISANRLSDGIVIFLCKDGQGASYWSPIQRDAFVADTEDAAEALLELALELEASDQEATGSYLIDVVREGNNLLATKLKEKIRAEGPTVQTELNNSGHARAA